MRLSTANNTAFDAAGAKPPLASGKLPGLMAPSASPLRSRRHVANPGNFTKAGTNPAIKKVVMYNLPAGPNQSAGLNLQ
jgi:hypothetical protein